MKKYQENPKYLGKQSLQNNPFFKEKLKQGILENITK